MSDVQLTLPDGAQKTYPMGTTPMEVAKGIATSLAKKAVSGKLNGQYVGMKDAIEQSGQFELIMKDDEEGLRLLRHSVSHLLAQALNRLYPDQIHYGVGPAIDNGFYYDTDKVEGNQISVDQFPEIEKMMKRIAKENLPIVSRE